MGSEYRVYRSNRFYQTDSQGTYLKLSKLLIVNLFSTSAVWLKVYFTISRATKDVVIDGIRIPQDEIVVPNLWSVHFDEKLYPDPHTFRPERFIIEEGKVVKSEHLVPFSIGEFYYQLLIFRLQYLTDLC